MSLSAFSFGLHYRVFELTDLTWPEIKLFHSYVYDPFRGWLTDILAPVVTTLGTGETRKYDALYAAIYAGKNSGGHYVIGTGGHMDSGIGMVAVQRLEDAFERDANFFILSPPKDSKERSTRQIVLQRALASLGLHFEHFDREEV